MKLEQRITAIVTGGASGLGEACVRHLAHKGVSVTIFDRDTGRGPGVAAEIGGQFVAVDVTDAGSIAGGITAAQDKFGPIRICVNCAGIAPAQKTVSKGSPHDPEVFKSVIMVNLVGTFLVSSQAAASMAAADPVCADGERGVIINTASVAAYDGQIGQAAYAASKAGVAGLTLPMARDLSRNGIRVMTIAPGLFGTPMLRGLPEDVQEALGKQVPFPPRLGDPDEFAALVAHIAENTMLNGEIIRLDGAIRMAPK